MHFVLAERSEEHVDITFDSIAKSHLWAESDMSNQQHRSVVKVAYLKRYIYYKICES